MKSIIIYSHPNGSDTGQHHRITTPTGERIYIRAEVVMGDLEEALEKAKPRKGETVLNSVELPPQ